MQYNKQYSYHLYHIIKFEFVLELEFICWQRIIVNTLCIKTDIDLIQRKKENKIYINYYAIYMRIIWFYM